MVNYSAFWETPDEISNVTLSTPDGEAIDIDDKVVFNFTTRQLTVFWHFPEAHDVELPVAWTITPSTSCPPQEHVIYLEAQRDHIVIDPAVHREQVGTCAAISDATEKKSVILPTFTIVGKSPNDLLPGSALLLNVGSVVAGDVYQIESDILGDYEMKKVGSEIAITPKPSTSSWTVSRMQDIARHITYSTTTTTPTTTPRTVSIRVTTFGSDTTTPAPSPLSTNIEFLTNNDLPNVIPAVTPAEIVISAAHNDAGSFVSAALPLSTYFTNAQFVTKWHVKRPSLLLASPQMSSPLPLRVFCTC